MVASLRERNLKETMEKAIGNYTTFPKTSWLFTDNKENECRIMSVHILKMCQIYIFSNIIYMDIKKKKVKNIIDDIIH